jgi:hypothetical protein
MGFAQAIVFEMIARVHRTESVPVQPSASLAQKFRGLAWRIAWTWALTGLAVATLVGVEVLGLAMLLDWWIELPWAIRLILFLAQVCFLGWLIAWHVVCPLLKKPSDEQLALAVERAMPQFRTRLIASVQLTRPGAIPKSASATMVAALVEQTEAFAAAVDFNSIVSLEKLKAIGAAAICVSGIAVAAFCYGRPVTAQLLKRACLSNTPVPRKTSVDVIEGQKTVGRGDDVRLQAMARGIVPKYGWLEIGKQKLRMERDANGIFVREISNVQEDFNYRIQLNDGRSELFHVRVLNRPAVLKMECEQHFPAYTRFPPTAKAPSELVLLAGSVLKLGVQPTKTIKTASIRLVGLDTNVPMEVANELRGQFSVPRKGLNGFSIQMRDTNGMDSKDSAVYRIEIVPDKAPLVRITSPARKEELFTRNAIANIGLDITDDFEIARVRFRFRIDDTNAPVQTVDLDIGKASSRLRNRFEWKLREVQPTLTIGSRIEFWVEAEDNNDVTGPGIGSSEHYFARIVTDEEKRSDLWNRASDTLSSINDLANDQDKLNESLGTLIRQKIAESK